jgi:hypothetical protein
MNFVRDFVVAVVGVIIFLLVSVWALNHFLVEPSRDQFRAECAAANGKAVWNGKHMECWR